MSKATLTKSMAKPQSVGAISEFTLERKYGVIHLSDTRYFIPASETGGLGDIEVTTPEPDVQYSWVKAAVELAKALAPVVGDWLSGDDDKDDDKSDNSGGSCRPVTTVNVGSDGAMTITHVACP